VGARHQASTVRAALIPTADETEHRQRDGADADRQEQRGGERVHPGDGTSRAMDEDKVAEINDYLVRRIPDVRVTNHYDFDREAQRFRVKHGRMVTHILFVDEAAVNHYSRDELNHLLDKAIHHLRLTAPEVEVRVSERGVIVQQVQH
jgi:ribosomal protein S4E